MLLSANKTKTTVILKDLIGCKLVVDSILIEKVMKLKCLGSSSARNLTEALKQNCLKH